MRTWTGLGLMAIAASLVFGGLQVTTAGDAEARRFKGGHHVGKHYKPYKYYRGRRIARGVAIGVGTAIAVDAATRGYRYSCSNLAYRCRHGEYWACNRFDERC